jgi:hypothetical protein
MCSAVAYFALQGGPLHCHVVPAEEQGHVEAPHGMHPHPTVLFHCTLWTAKGRGRQQQRLGFTPLFFFSHLYDDLSHSPQHITATEPHTLSHWWPVGVSSDTPRSHGCTIMCACLPCHATVARRDSLMSLTRNLSQPHAHLINLFPILTHSPPLAPTICW